MLGVIFILARKNEMQAILETLQRGDLRFLILALAIQFFWLLNVAASYRAIYRSLQLTEKIERLFLMAAAANFVNVIAPSVGMGGMAVFIGEARRKGQSAARVTVAGVLYILFEYVGFLMVLALGLIVLFRRNNLATTELIASGVLFVIATGLGILLWLGMRSAAELGRALSWLARSVNKLVFPFLRREYLSEERAYAFAHDAAAGLREVRRRREYLLLPAVLSLSSKALLISILFLMFLAFRVPFSVGTLVAGFSIGYLFMIVSPTPAGIGVVEGALTLGLRTLNVPLGAAAVIALAYRGITFWVPMLFGLWAFRWLTNHQGIESEA